MAKLYLKEYFFLIHIVKSNTKINGIAPFKKQQYINAVVVNL